MSSTQGSIETQEAIERFAEALHQRIGADRYRLWFTHGVGFDLEVGESPDDGKPTVVVVIRTSGPFAAQRMGNSFATELRAAAMIACGERSRYRIDVEEAEQPAPKKRTRAAKVAAEEKASTKSSGGRRSTARQTSGRASTGRASTGRSSGGRRGSANSLANLLAQSTATGDDRSGGSRGGRGRSRGRVEHDPIAASELPEGDQFDDEEMDDEEVVVSTPRASKSKLPPLPESQPTGGRTLESFITGPCNEFAFSAAMMAVATPSVATPLFLHGPTGTGKSHLLAALANEFRTRRRMRRVVLLTAEQFTNDFVVSVGSTGLPAFRRRYRDVDALLIDDVHFLAAKTATLREALYTVETLASAGKPLVFSANLPPSDIRGLTGEVAGRMASGLVCPLAAIDQQTRFQLLQRMVATRCVLGCDNALLEEVSELIGGDARAAGGIANLIGMLQRMFRREPTIDEIRRYGGDLLRSTQVAPTLRSIEKAVCETFGLEGDGLRSKAQTRRVSEPRTLAMYLARQHTGSAFTEIAKHFNRRSHSNAISAITKVETWLSSGKPIGAGDGAMSAQDAIARVESRLRVG
ncbi:Chromosomal replication initiator protein DnaA [Rhodopirellula islandica]|uniref:Chromosomal replication initiator protein DnaA n=1 Tax=Rhodopirellula islandica TaxID=595434 RepID=A0A0J1B4L4_RHOIS|nr:DnaA/Hda family protein [Rhodopirellula islandica]KLU01558.1 Chromosomal replication initiator protein DnaA [Rhodopirellula islandica]